MPELNASAAQKIARYLLLGSLVLLGGWMLRHFLPALCWAVVLAIGTSSVYDRWLRKFNGQWRHVWAALTFTALVGLVVIVPLVYGGVAAVREAIILAHSFADSSRNGPPALPEWLLQIPWLGDWIHGLWMEQFSHVDTATGVALHTKPAMFQWTRMLGVQLFKRASTLVFTLLTLYFVYLNRDRLRLEAPQVARRLFGPTVEPLLIRAVEAIRATVDGVVLVAVAEGAVMCAVYALAGTPHPLLFGVLTGVLAMVPFAAPLLIIGIAVMLATHGAVGAGISVMLIGSLLLFIADHFVRPVIIGNGARLPFLWVLLGILGGIESFGLVGIFLGPALMAALVSLWRGWVDRKDAT